MGKVIRMLLPLHILLSSVVVDAPGCVDTSDERKYLCAVLDEYGADCAATDERKALCQVSDERSCA